MPINLRSRFVSVFSSARLSPVRQNIFANLAGNGATALATLVCAPVYAHILGIEAYGLIGVYMTLQTVCIFLDMGFSTTINREIARLSVEPDKAREMRNLVRTLEVIYWLFGVVICVSIVLLAPAIANHWLHFQKMKPSEGEQAIRIAGLAISLRWPLSLYSGGLMGLQRQVLLNWITSTSAILQSVGAVIALRLIAPTTMVFFVWQVGMAAVPVAWARYSLSRCLPPSNESTRYSPRAFWSLWRFTAGAGAFTATSMMFNQVDRVVLSKMVSLEDFGYYNLAAVAAGAIYRLVLPIFTALFPLFSSLLAVNDLKRLTQSYHRGCALASVLIWPSTVVGVLFSGPILLAWTRNAATADATHTIMALLLAGSAFNALIYVPYALQLAYGWTTLGLYMNVFGLVAAGALLPIMISYYGAVGAAAAKLLISCAVFALGPWIMHRRVLTGEKLRWYVNDVAKPFAVASVCAVLAALVGMSAWPQWLTILYILGVFAFTSAATALVLEDAREILSSIFSHPFSWFRKAMAVGSVRTL